MPKGPCRFIFGTTESALGSGMKVWRQVIQKKSYVITRLVSMVRTTVMKYSVYMYTYVYMYIEMYVYNIDI